MADEVLAEKPKKAKRAKSATKKPPEEIQLATMDGSSKFNQLLQQAVDQTMSDAKEKKKKKKKSDSKDNVLESLRKGEGLQKEEDQTKKANTFDPDDTKYEKSNKKKQKLLNKQNEMEVIDETKDKPKKKKKLKQEDELILSPEIDTEKQTPVKKKKKPKQDETPVTSARSEDEPSVVTPKKSKKKKTAEEEVEEEMRKLEEEIVTPTKKGKKKKEVGEADGTMSPSEDTPSKVKKKKKKPGDVLSEEEILSPRSDVASPKGKGKKKKAGGGMTDEEALSPAEDVASPREGKKKKKKKGEETDEDVLSPTEEPSTSTGKKKKKKGEKGKEEEVLSQEEDIASPREKEKKKKKKMKKGDDEEVVEEPSTSTEAPKAKARKKKAQDKEGEEEEEAKVEEEEEEAEPSGMDVEDRGRILAVTIHRTDKLKNDFYIRHPMIRVHIFDELTGQYLPKQHKDRAVTAFYETLNENVKTVLPIMTKPFDFKREKSVLPVWEELLVFNENYDYFIQTNPKTLVVFELLDTVSMNRAARNDGHEKGWHRIAWAFLKVLGNNKKINTGSKVRLQLFEPPTGLRKKQDMPEVFQWWKEGGRKSYPSTLYVTLKGIVPPQEVEPAERSLFATQGERGKMTYDELKKSINWTGKKEVKTRSMSSWSRLAGQLCRLPNKLSLALPTAKKGCYIIRFSHDGRSIACACQGKEGFPILVYEIPSGTLKGKFLGHFGIVYDLSWSKMDDYLLSASSDGTARVWDVRDFHEQQLKLLPHPAFVYCSQFHSRVDTLAITGGFDQVIRVWDVGEEGNTFSLKMELTDHVGYVNSICFSEDGQKMYSADSIGVIIIWNSFFTEVPSKRGIAREWTVFQKIEDPEIKGTAINFIALHPRERRLLVHCRDNIIRMFDLRIQRVMQKYIGALNFREQIRSGLSPCGSFVFSGSEDNYAYAWNTDTGDQVIMYSELNYQNPVTDIHYHPREHMVAFCSLGENHPILIYSYDPKVAQYEAGLSPREISPTPRQEDTLGTPDLAKELASKGVLSKEEFQIHNTARYDKIMRTLNNVTAQMTATPIMDLPGMAPSSPRMGTTMSMGYDSSYRATPRSMAGSPTMFSPHAQRSMTSIMSQQQFQSQNLYMKGADWRPQFSEVGQFGRRSTSPVLGRAPQMNFTASQQGKAMFNFQAAPGKAIKKEHKVVVLYDYKAQRSDELDLFAGDEVTVLYKDTENWWMGELADGQQGFFPSNYVTEEDELMSTHSVLTPDTSDSESRNVTAVKTKSGELRLISGEEDSGDDLLSSSRRRRKKKRNSEDSGATLSSASQQSDKKPPRKPNQRVRIDESTSKESTA